jgi:hypothetical protein
MMVGRRELSDETTEVNFDRVAAFIDDRPASA